MAHFCETFNEPVDSVLTVGFDEVWFPASGHFDIVNEQSTYHSCNWPNKAYRVAELDSEDMGGYITINRLDEVPAFGRSYGFNYAAMCFRIVDFLPPNATYYQVEYAWHVSFGYFVEIAKYVANVRTTLAFVPRAFSPGDILKGSVEGSTLKAYINGVLLATVTDSSITGSKRIGMEYFADCATGFGGIVCDNYFGGDVADGDFT